MRLVGAALLLALTSVPALADDGKPAKSTETRAHVPLRVVRMLPDADQALLFDRSKGTYVAVGAGEAIEGFTVDSVDDDEVTLVSDAGATVVLAAPARHRRVAETGTADDGDEAERPTRHRPRAERVAAAEPADPYAGGAQQPADPYAGGPQQPADPYAAGQPADPYADVQTVPAGSLGTGAGGVRVVDASAPAIIGAGTAPTTVIGTGPAPTTVIGTGADGVRVTSVATGVASVPAPATATASAPATVSAPAAVPAPATAAGSAPATGAASTHADGAAALAAALTGAPEPAATTTTAGPTVLARTDVSTALSNFAALSQAIRGTFTPDGLRIDGVTAGSVFAKAGLVAGDVVTSVDGKPLRSLDDAADLYARASKARSMNAQLVRGGKPVALRVAIQ